MQLRVYLYRVALEAGLILVCTLPFVLICRLALPNAALALVIVGSILSGLERRPRRNTSAGWFPTPALELAGVHPLDGMAFLAHRARARNLPSLNWRDVAIPARLAEAVGRRFAGGDGGTRSLLHAWCS